MNAISKIEAALIQLGEAINLYNAEKHIPAITLAGAAEEIFSRLGSELLGGKTRFDNASITADIMAMTLHGVEDIDALNDKERSEIYARIGKEYLTEHNRVRNELKHKSDPNENYVVAISFQRRAFDHICNAITNIILSRTMLPYKEPLIEQFCKTVGLSDPYLNKENWAGA